MTQQRTSISYKDAGVDIDAGEELVQRIKHAAHSTRRKEVLTGLGGFGALFELPAGYREPVLVSGTDGVGTKLRLALDHDRHSGVGIDLVAMCVNDLVVCGAEPLFFLDYYASGRLDVATAESVINGIADGCLQAGCALIGGETAEMPGMYEGDDYDLAGFCVGIVEKSEIIDGSAVREGDVLIGLASSGPHSNGYSLIRKIIEVTGTDPAAEQVDGKPLLDLLMAPTRIYVRPLLELKKNIGIKALAHITGGGLLENVPRVLPHDCNAFIDIANWHRPAVFDWLQRAGNIAPREMYRTLNCGIGMVLCVSPEDADSAVNLLRSAGETVSVIGEIVENRGNQPEVELAGL